MWKTLDWNKNCPQVRFQGEWLIFTCMFALDEPEWKFKHRPSCSERVGGLLALMQDKQKVSLRSLGKNCCFPLQAEEQIPNFLHCLHLKRKNVVLNFSKDSTFLSRVKSLIKTAQSLWMSSEQTIWCVARVNCDFRRHNSRSVYDLKENMSCYFGNDKGWEFFW